MELNALSESQQELLHPLIRLKTDTSFDSLLILRDVFSDLSVAYNNFSSAVKNIEDKITSCYKLASSGTFTQEACEALLLVRGNLPNASNIVQSVTAEQPGLLKVLESLVDVIKRIKNESQLLSLTLDKSVTCALSGFAKQYVDKFGKDDTSIDRNDDVSTLILNLQTFKHSNGYSQSPIRKQVDNVLKSYKEYQHYLSNERAVIDQHGTDYNNKSVRKAKSRTLRSKASLNKYIKELFIVAPDLEDLNDVNVNGIIYNKKGKHKKIIKPDIINFIEFHGDFYKFEKQRLELLFSCLQIWVDHHIKLEKGIYSQMEILWDDILKFSPNNDFNKFENLITGNESITIPQHSRILINSKPGPINDYTSIALNTFSQCPTPINNLSDFESDIMSGRILDDGTYTNLYVAQYKSDDEDDDVKSINTTKHLNYPQYEPLLKSSNKSHNPITIIDTTEGQSTPPEVQSNSDPTRRGAPSNYLSLKGEATPGDCGEESETIHGSRGEVNREATTASGMKSSTGPQVEPGSDLRELEGELNREGHHGEWKTSGGMKSSTGPRVEPEADLREAEGKVNRIGSTPSGNVSRIAPQIEIHQQDEEDVEIDKILMDFDRKQHHDHYIPSVNSIDVGIKDIDYGVNIEQVAEYIMTRRGRYDEYMRRYLDLIEDFPSFPPDSSFSFLYNDDIIDITGILEYHHLYPFDVHFHPPTSGNRFNCSRIELSKDRIPMPRLKYCLEDSYMDNNQWCILSLEIMIMTHRYISGFINHPCLTDDNHGDGQLREYLMLNLGILEQMLIRMRHLIEVYKNRLDLSHSSYSILDVLLKPRDVFSDYSPHINLHVMDVRYRILLLIDSLSKVDVVIDDVLLIENKEYYQWVYRQLHIIHLSLIQKLSRIVHLLDADSNISSRWFKIINSFTPFDDLSVTFHFDASPNLERLCNDILILVCLALGEVNHLKALVVVNLNHVIKPLDIKGRLLKMLEYMVEVEYYDRELVNVLDGCGGMSEVGMKGDGCREMKGVREKDEGSHAMRDDGCNAHSMKNVNNINNDARDVGNDVKRLNTVHNRTRRRHSKHSNNTPHDPISRHKKPHEQILMMDDYIVDLDIYSDDNISVLAEIRQRRSRCMSACHRLSRYNMVRYVMDQVVNDGMAMRCRSNKYFRVPIDAYKLSGYWSLEVPIILHVTECLHQYLSCDELTFSDVPQYFQGIIYIVSFMQTGILPNFNITRSLDYIGDQFQIPLFAHSILASIAFWTLHVVHFHDGSTTLDGNPSFKKGEEEEYGSKRGDEDYTSRREGEYTSSSRNYETSTHQTWTNHPLSTPQTSPVKYGTSNLPHPPSSTPPSTSTNQHQLHTSTPPSTSTNQHQLHTSTPPSTSTHPLPHTLQPPTTVENFGIDFKSTFHLLSCNILKQLYVMNQVPSNIYFLPKGLSSLDGYLIFDLKKFLLNYDDDIENLLPNYTVMDKGHLDYIDWSSIKELKHLLKMQLKGMYLKRPFNKVHLFTSDILNYHVPLVIPSEGSDGNDGHELNDSTSMMENSSLPTNNVSKREEEDSLLTSTMNNHPSPLPSSHPSSMMNNHPSPLTSSHPPSMYNPPPPVNNSSSHPPSMYNPPPPVKNYTSLLLPSRIEREVLTILYLRIATSAYRNNIFNYSCKFIEYIDTNGLYYILSLLNIYYKLLYKGYNTIDLYRFIVYKNAKLMVKKCIEHVNDITTELDDTILFNNYIDDIIQMLRNECKLSYNMWNNFLIFAEYPSLLSNCCILELKNYYNYNNKSICNIMPNLRKFMILQREYDVSFIIRSPLQDNNKQSITLLKCMFYLYTNPNFNINGINELLLLIKSNIIKGLESKFNTINNIIKTCINNESWIKINDKTPYTNGIIDLFVVLQYSLRAIFDFQAPTEWIISPFFNACIQILESYLKFISNLYHVKNLQILFNHINIKNIYYHHPHEVQSNSPSTRHPPEVTTLSSTRRGASSNYQSLKGRATPGDRGGRGGSDVTSGGSGLPGSGLRELEGEINREGHHGEWKTSDGLKYSTGPQVEPGSDLRKLEGEINREGHHGEWKTSGGKESRTVTSGGRDDINLDYIIGNDEFTDIEGLLMLLDSSIMRVLSVDDEDVILIEKKKSRIWKSKKVIDFNSRLSEYCVLIGNGNVMYDLVRVWNLEYLSQQIMKMPDELLGYYYDQIRQRDEEYIDIHKDLGTIYDSDPNKFFYFEPKQLLMIPYSKSLVDLVNASQRILKNDTKRLINDLLIIISLKIIFVDFKIDLFDQLYTTSNYTITKLINKFPYTLNNFTKQLPKDHQKYFHLIFFYILIKVISFIINKIRCTKCTRDDYDALNQVLEDYHITSSNNIKKIF